MHGGSALFGCHSLSRTRRAQGRLHGVLELSLDKKKECSFGLVALCGIGACKVSPQERWLEVGCQLEWSEEGVLAWDQSDVGRQSEQHEGGIHKGGGDLAWVFRACVCMSCVCPIRRSSPNRTKKASACVSRQLGLLEP